MASPHRRLKSPHQVHRIYPRKGNTASRTANARRNIIFIRPPDIFGFLRCATKVFECEVFTESYQNASPVVVKMCVSGVSMLVSVFRVPARARNLARICYRNVYPTRTVHSAETRSLQLSISPQNILLGGENCSCSAQIRCATKLIVAFGPRGLPRKPGSHRTRAEAIFTSSCFLQ